MVFQETPMLNDAIRIHILPTFSTPTFFNICGLPSVSYIIAFIITKLLMLCSLLRPSLLHFSPGLILNVEREINSIYLMCLCNYFFIIGSNRVLGFNIFSMDNMSRFLGHLKENFSGIKTKLILFLSHFLHFSLKKNLHSGHIIITLIFEL